METIEQNIGSQELYQHLKTHGRAEIDSWAINADGVETWLTNPYSIDMGFYANNTEGYADVLECVSIDDHEREWGTLQCSRSEFKATDTRHGTGAVV